MFFTLTLFHKLTNPHKAYPPVLLERKAKRIRKNLDAEKAQTTTVRTIFDAQGVDRS